jgi:hypothetical protein
MMKGELNKIFPQLKKLMQRDFFSLDQSVVAKAKIEELAKQILFKLPGNRSTLGKLSDKLWLQFRDQLKSQRDQRV